MMVTTMPLRSGQSMSSVAVFGVEGVGMETNVGGLIRVLDTEFC
jgi:hypothetical protein